eukprot:5355935-Pyramimonas_sp.AAC.1
MSTAHLGRQIVAEVRNPTVAADPADACADPRTDFAEEARRRVTVRGWERMCEDVRGCARMLDDARGCERIFEDVRGCERTLEDVRGCERMREDVRRC